MGNLEDPIETQIKTFRNDDEVALHVVLQDFDESRRTAEADFHPAWDRYYRHWRAKLKKPRNYPLVSTTFIPMTHGLIETMVPFYMDAVFDSRRFITGVGQTPDDQEDAKLVGQYQNYQFIHRIGYESKLTDTLRSALIFGAAWQKVMLDVSSRPIMGKMSDVQRERASAQIQQSGKKERLKYFDGPNVEFVSPYDVYPDFSAKTPEKMRFLCHEYTMPLSELKAMEMGKNDEVLLKNLDEVLKNSEYPGETQDKEIGRLESQGKGSGRSDATIHMTDDSKREDPIVQIVDWWTPTWLIRVVNRKVVIYNDVNPMPFQKIPFVLFSITRDPGFLFGMGIAEVAESPQNVVNVLQNQKLDNVNLILNPPTKVRRTAAINTKQLVSRPGGFIMVNNPDDVTAHIMQDVTGTAIANIQDMMQHAQNASGVLDFVRGAQPETSRFPATGISLLQRAAGRRFTLTAKHINTAITEVIGMAHAIDAEFTEGERYARVIGIDGVAEYPTIDGALLGETLVDFFPIGKAANGNPEVLLQQLSELDARWENRQEFTSEGRLELMRSILDLAQIPNREMILPPVAAQPAPGTENQGTPGPLTLEQVLQPGQQSQPGPGGAPLAVLPQPPSTTNPGGNRQISAPIAS